MLKLFPSRRNASHRQKARAGRGERADL